MQTKQLAAAFIEGRKGSCHNATSNGTEYSLHGHVICRAVQLAEGLPVDFTFDWCGWYTSTTARHMNAILDAIGFTADGTRCPRVSYSQARDGKSLARFTITAKV